MKMSGAAIIILLLCAAHPAAAQVSQLLSSTTATPSLPKTDTPATSSAILIRVVETNKAPFAEQAVVQLRAARTQSITYGTTESDGRVTFEGLVPGRYTITVSAAGYRTTQRTADVLSRNGYYEKVVELHRDPSSIAVVSHDAWINAAPASKTAAGLAQLPPQAAVAEPSWRPIGVDEEKLVTALDTPCPCERILDGTSERVEQLVDNINRFDATERVMNEDLNNQGKVVKTERRKFDYVVNINKLFSGDLDVDEYRNGRNGYEDFPDQIATLGLPSLAFVFHPKYTADYDFRCEGLGNWNRHAVWLVYFKQRSDQPIRIRGYDINNVLHPVGLKGRAWIAADSFQIMRMEADIVSPLPKIQLRDEHQVVEYQPVSFHSSDVKLWLPKSAEVYFDFRNHKYHRVHSFSDYMLFSVSATEKIGMPKEFAKQ